MKKKSLTLLGKEFKSTKSEKSFKELYERLQRGVINYYSNFGKDRQLIEDAYEEAMVSIWANIDKLDVENYSISTSVYMKTKQCIIKANNKKVKTTGEGGLSFNENGENWTLDGTIYNNSIDSSNIVKVDKYQEYMCNRVHKSQEDIYIETELLDEFWSMAKKCRFYNEIYDFYFNGFSHKELSNKYGVEIQIIKNRIFHGKKEIKQILGTNEKFIEIFN